MLCSAPCSVSVTHLIEDRRLREGHSINKIDFRRRKSLTCLLQSDRTRRKEAAVSRSARRQGDRRPPEDDAFEVGAGGDGNGSVDDPDDVARQSAAREDDLLARGDGQRASDLEYPG